jgi:hypothetical protein
LTAYDSVQLAPLAAKAARNRGSDDTMAIEQPQQPTPIRHVDLPDLPETFTDSIHTMVWDGQTLRVEFCVTRYPEVPSAPAAEAKRYPSCRLVLTSHVAVDLFNRLQQTMAALAQSGFASQHKPQPKGSA